MNGATSKSFMRNLTGSDFTSHKAKRRFFEAADLNKAVGMQKGKNLFTSTHSMSPEPSIEVAAVAKQEGEDIAQEPSAETPNGEEKENKKVKGNLNYTPEKATIVAMKLGCYKK